MAVIVLAAVNCLAQAATSFGSALPCKMSERVTQPTSTTLPRVTRAAPCLRASTPVARARSASGARHLRLIARRTPVVVRPPLRPADNPASRLATRAFIASRVAALPSHAECSFQSMCATNETSASLSAWDASTVTTAKSNRPPMEARECLRIVNIDT